MTSFGIFKSSKSCKLSLAVCSFCSFFFFSCYISVLNDQTLESTESYLWISKKLFPPKFSLKHNHVPESSFYKKPTMCQVSSADGQETNISYPLHNHLVKSQHGVLVSSFKKSEKKKSLKEYERFSCGYIVPLL